MYILNFFLLNNIYIKKVYFKKMSQTSTNSSLNNFQFKEDYSSEAKLLNHKRFRKEDIIWTFEEDYLFFESHNILGNKWKKYKIFFKNKNIKEIKNHFHTSVIKTVRRIINNKFDIELKDIMRSFYAFEYLIHLINLIKNNLPLTKTTLSIIKNTEYKFNPKMLINTKKLSEEMIINYKKKLTEILLNKENIKNFLKEINLKNFNENHVFWLFSTIIKIKTANKTKKFYEENKDTLDEEKKKKLKEFIESNNDLLNLEKYFL